MFFLVYRRFVESGGVLCFIEFSGDFDACRSFSLLFRYCFNFFLEGRFFIKFFLINCFRIVFYFNVF